MQAIILAAGMGKRLGKYTAGNTKCMVKVGNSTLIERACNALKKAGIKKLVMVCGYKADNLINFMNENISDMDITYIKNDIYDKTNNIYSLFLAKDYLAQDDTILLESDLIFDESIIEKLVNSPAEDMVVVDKYKQWMDGTVTLIDKFGYIADFIEKKDFSFDIVDNYFKTVNIYKFSKEFSKDCYLPFLNAYITAYGKNEYYELVLKTIAHLSRSRLKAFKLTNEKWYEIDDAQDLDIADTMFAEYDDELNLYQKRYGGYWRFPELKDYCYLVNPYFPSKHLLDKLKMSFDTLITQYPSGQDINDINAGRMFNIDNNKIVVGNGAAELINSLRNVIKGKVTLSIPSFNEYVRCLSGCEFSLIDSSKFDYQYNIDELINSLNSADNLIIINPDNPSGSFINRSDMKNILDCALKLGKRVIVDESFVDFAEEDKYYTLLNEDILNKYPNLIVIKSISKSYGIPGLRIGVLASSNADVIKTVKRDISIWNINSFAEYFLQIISLYKCDYQKACSKIINERTRMKKELSKIDYLKVYDSQANYFMCRIENDLSSTVLAKKLLNEQKIFIKDLKNKTGFYNDKYIRLAVRDENDDNILIDALKNFKF